MSVVLAISGGIDSMVMLDIFAHELSCENQYSPHDISNTDRYSFHDINRTADYAARDIIIAHFDHGTRKSSIDDARFVSKIVKTRHLPYMLGSSNLGENVSEETARNYRYQFLRDVSAQNNHAVIYTAHHLDDLVESIAINILRGTGWRGLAALDTPGIRRPLLEPELLPEELRDAAPFDKLTVYRYAAKKQIVFRQDPTNHEDTYLRNRVRQKLANFEQKSQLYTLWQQQKQLKQEINSIVQDLLPAKDMPWQRSWFRELEPEVALELLRAGTLRANIPATRPQLENFRQAILTYRPGKYFNLPEDNLIKINKTTFYL